MLIVRCPACQTTFRAKPEHLGARAGRVRCGSCFTPFNALENLIDSTPADTTSEEKPSSTGVPAQIPTEAVSEAGEKAEAESSDEARNTEAHATPIIELSSSDLDERLALALSPSNEIDLGPGKDVRKPDYRDDLDLHEALTEPPDITPDDTVAGERRAHPVSPVPADRGSDTHGALRWSPVSNPGIGAPTPLSKAMWPTLVAQPPEPETIQPGVFAPSETFPGDNGADEDSSHTPSTDPDNPPATGIAIDPDDRRWRRVTDERREPAFTPNTTSMLDTGIEHNPDFTHYTRGESRGRVWLWALMVGALLGSLAVQSAYVFRVELARDWPQLRPIFVDLCNRLACDMPLPRNVQAINVTASNLESDPDAPTSFVLHARLRNEASYLQAHPHLELTLTDARDRPVARRVLEPGEWLSSEAVEAGFGGRTEVEVRLPFRAPELTNAAGYRLYAFYP